MKFQPERPEGVNLISHHTPGEIKVGQQIYPGSVLVPWQGQVQVWPPRGLSQLHSAHFSQVLELGPELVIFGSGQRLRFPHPSLLHILMASRIGVETMDTAAACRTYNVLVSEGRRVVAALLDSSLETQDMSR